MCGICGIYTAEVHDDLGVRARRMTDQLVHRGPDAGGVFVDDGVALGHRRLSIIDLSESGSQPMTLGRATIVYNGESYNFRELRKELEAAGRSFRGHSDTEVALHAYDMWGLDGLARLEGIFALALWDSAERKLVLMRDRLGIKPLFYSWNGKRLVFGSEIKAILAGAQIDTRIDDQALSEYLWYGNAYQDRTMFREVRALEPGQRLIASGTSIELETWWKVEEWLDKPAFGGGPREAADAVREALDLAVERQLVSDVPVCVFLSGGVDSSGIAAAAMSVGRQQLKSFAVGFDFAGGVDELPKARAVAEHLHLDHHELHVSGGDIQSVVEKLVEAHDEPFADAANIPLYLLAKELHGSVKVALQGDGGDEMFAGYRRYAVLDQARAWQYWPRWLDRLLDRLPGKQAARLARLGAAAGNASPAMRMALLLTMETQREPPGLVLGAAMRDHLDTQTDPFAAYHQCAERFAHLEPVLQMLMTDMSLQLPSQFLAKVDRATMACSLEARVPLLDERVASLAVSMPSELKVSRGQRKIALRDSLRSRVPDSILDAPKTGFGVPYGEWLRSGLKEFARAALFDAAFIEDFGLEEARIAALFNAHSERRLDRGFLLWKLMQLSLWNQSYRT